MEKQIEFPEQQTHVKWVTPVVWLVSIVCIVVVAIMRAVDVEGPFIGPW